MLSSLACWSFSRLLARRKSCLSASFPEEDQRAQALDGLEDVGRYAPDFEVHRVLGQDLVAVVVERVVQHLQQLREHRLQLSALVYFEGYVLEVLDHQLGAVLEEDLGALQVYDLRAHLAVQLGHLALVFLLQKRVRQSLLQAVLRGD